jgi:hypothetical protein
LREDVVVDVVELGIAATVAVSEYMNSVSAGGGTLFVPDTGWIEVLVGTTVLLGASVSVVRLYVAP